MKRILLPIAICTFLLSACGGSKTETTETASNAPTEATAPAASTEADSRGLGPIKEVKLDATINDGMAGEGQKVYDVKCSSCHKLTDEKLVGPGWKGVTSRRTPEWIMNFSVNPEENLNKDPAAMTMLQECLIRMPNQNLTEKDARDVLEFMRKNDSK